MKRLVVAALVALSAAACSVSAATGNVATVDAGATKACADLRQFVQDRAGLSPRAVLDRMGQLNADAQASANPIIQARAVALYTDASYLAQGAGSGSLASDLAAMKQACLPGPG
jgi:hypothetical protein